MTEFKVEDANVARDYLSGLEVFGRSSSLESVAAAALPQPSYVDGKPQAVAVGSQITEFADNVPESRRPQIANSFLLAQLAANKVVREGGDTAAWYEQYIEVLSNVGWLIETQISSTRDVSGGAAELHQEIIPVITAALGPAVAAAALVTKVLDGLAAMNKDLPWITLFSKESQRAHANQFQVSYAEVPEGMQPRITLTCFELDAQKSITQVLFFKFSDSSGRLRHFGSKLSMNSGVFDKVEDVVEDRVAEFATSYITGIPI